MNFHTNRFTETFHRNKKNLQYIMLWF